MLTKLHNLLFAKISRLRINVRRLMSMRYSLQRQVDTYEHLYTVTVDPDIRYRFKFHNDETMRQGVQDLLNVLLLTEGAWREHQKEE